MTVHKIISNTIAELEDAFDPREFEYAGMNYWPLIRHLVSEVFVHPDAKVKSSNKRNSVKSAGRALARLAGRRSVHRAASGAFGHLLRIVYETLGPHQTDVLFFTVGFEYQRDEEGWYNKFFDPLKELLDPAGVGHVDVRGEYEGRRHDPHLHPVTDICLCVSAANALAWMLHLSGGVSLKPYARFRDHAIAGNSRFDALPTEDDLQLRLDTIAAYTWMFRALLIRARPSLGILTCYYHEMGMAFARACHMAKIKSLELQHSYINEADWNWLGWRHTIDVSSTLLPDFFGAWDVRTERLFDEKRPLGALMPLVLGNLWLEKQCAELASRRDVVRRWDRGIRVLYTAPCLCEVAPPVLLEAIQRSPPEVEWLVRLHYQTTRETARRIERVLMATGGHVEFRPHGRFDLYELFIECDAHITETSTTALEATGFGLRSIIIGQEGLNWFADEIREGALVYALTANEIIEKIRESAKRRRSEEETTAHHYGKKAVAEVKALCERRSDSGLQTKNGLAEEFDAFYTAHYGKRDIGNGIPAIGSAAVKTFTAIAHAQQVADKIRRMVRRDHSGFPVRSSQGS